MDIEPTFNLYSITSLENHLELHLKHMRRQLLNRYWIILLYYKMEIHLSELKYSNLRLNNLEKIRGLYNKTFHQQKICFDQWQHQVNELLINKILFNTIGILANQLHGSLEELFSVQYEENNKKSTHIYQQSAKAVDTKFNTMEFHSDYFNLLTMLIHQANTSDAYSLLSAHITLAFINCQYQQNAVIDETLGSHSGKLLLLTLSQLKQQIQIIHQEIHTTNDNIDQCDIISHHFHKQNNPIYNRNSNINRYTIELLNHSRRQQNQNPETNQWIFVLDQHYILNISQPIVSNTWLGKRNIFKSNFILLSFDQNKIENEIRKFKENTSEAMDRFAWKKDHITFAVSHFLSQKEIQTNHRLHISNHSSKETTMTSVRIESKQLIYICKSRRAG